MTTIAILGASSHIAKDLIHSFVKHGRSGLLLYVRNIETTALWLDESGLRSACSLHTFDQYGKLPHDVVINFVGVGDPRRAAEMGSSIFHITSEFDDLVLADLARNSSRRYFFLSSGAIYGNCFAQPVSDNSEVRISINDIAEKDYYAMAKLYAEVRHRSHPNLSIIDLRVFNYFSRTQDIEARFFITDIVRAIRDGQILNTSAEYMVRDYLHPEDFHRMIVSLLNAGPCNCAVDCYTRGTVDKPSLLEAMRKEFGLHFNFENITEKMIINATGTKPHYYSLSRKAAQFGYVPCYSSLEGILIETVAMLDNNSFASTTKVLHGN